MPYKINEQQIRAVSALGGSERYAHFVQRVADWQELWSLKADDGFVGFGDDEGNSGVPFWPHPAYAEKHASGDWSNCKPARIELADFLGNWLGGMERDGVKAIIFPTPDMKGVVVEPARLRSDLAQAIEQYE